MNWYISQTIIAIKSHDQGVFKKGDEFTIKSLSKSFCKCQEVLIDIGISTHAQLMKCYKCGIIQYNPSNYRWFSENYFAPLDQDISELTDILKEPIKESVIK